MGSLFNSKADAIRMACKKFQLIQEIGPVPILPKRRKIGGNISVKLIQHQLDNPRLSLSAMVRFIWEEFSVKVSRTLVASHLKEHGFKVRVAKKRPLLSQQNKEKRLAFALEWVEQPEKYRRILWTDETTVCCFPNYRRILVRTREDSAPYFVPTKQNGGFKIMFWGCFSAGARGALIALDGSVNQHSYKELLRDVAIPEMRASEVPLVFMQDNAAAHTAKSVKIYLEQQGIETMKWPAQSPDLNPIETGWAIMKQRLYSQETVPKNADELCARVYALWNEVSVSTLSGLSLKHFNKLYEVIHNKGGRI